MTMSELKGKVDGYGSMGPGMEQPNPFTVSGGPPMGNQYQSMPNMGGGGYPVPPMTSQGPMQMGGGMGGSAPPAPGQVQQGWLPGVSRPQMTQVTNPPVVSHNIQYGPSYSMAYSKRSTADKTAVKYTGFLPLEGVYEEDTCRIG